MAPEELHLLVKQQPFEPFRIVMTDGAAYDIRHPELLMVGKRIAYVGLSARHDDPLFERTVRVDLLHVIRTEPLTGAASNGSGS